MDGIFVRLNLFNLSFQILLVTGDCSKTILAFFLIRLPISLGKTIYFLFLEFPKSFQFFNLLTSLLISEGQALLLNTCLFSLRFDDF
ncbi:Uncharacterised protein [Streptococcus pneumoniae]|nr:Uncharacterised protein [Streptococcus pneumoniae]